MKKRKSRRLSKNQQFRKTRAWRICRVVVIRRDEVCQICGNRKDREVHHIKSSSYYPELATDPDNCILLCKRCHRHKFHNLYKGGYRKKTDEKDLFKFMSLIAEVKNEIKMENINGN